MPWTKVYIDNNEIEATLSREGLRAVSYREAIREALMQMLDKDDNVLLMGEGVTDPDGIFGSTAGLYEKFGQQRVLDIPIAENGLTGVAIGSAMAGMKPVFVHMRMDFLPMCIDQIINHGAKWHYMTGGAVNVPIVIRSIIGRGWGSAAQHSQALHALFTQVPGLKVVMPSSPYDAKGLLIDAIEDGNPVMFIEHRWVYDYLGYVPEEIYKVPIGKGIVRKEGTHVTVVAISQMVYEAVKASKELSKDDIDIEIIDPRTLKPLDEELLFESVKKTGRLVIADVAHKTGGIGGEIATRVCEEIFYYLKGPIKRINFPDTPIPCSPALEDAFYPDASHVVNKVKEFFQDGKH